MQAIGETVFDILYLSTALILGLIMLGKGRSSLVKKAGAMTLLLGAGDAFHLVPRCYALLTTGLADHAAALGIGKLITSVTMTVFYLLLYYIWREHYQVQGRQHLTRLMWAFSGLRVLLCLLPQNDWLSANPPLFFGILRNIPFAVMGAVILALFLLEQKRSEDKTFAHVPLAVGLSFGFYIPVVLFSGIWPLIGMLMIPKTLAYVWIIFMCWKLYRKEA